MMVVLFKVATTMFMMAQAWALMLLLFVYFLAFWSFFALLQPCG